jgi:hypothetical protein
MNPEFNIGDTVINIDPCDDLVLQNFYVVRWVDQCGLIWVDIGWRKRGGYKPYRFRKVDSMTYKFTPGDTVELVSFTHGNYGSANNLTLGKRYTVLAKPAYARSDQFTYVKNDAGEVESYIAGRFKKVEDMKQKLRVDDKVMIVRKTEDYNGDWANSWVDDMVNRIGDGKVYTITGITSAGVVLKGTPYRYDPASLELHKLKPNVKTDTKISAGSETKGIPTDGGLKYDGGKLLFRALTRGLALPLKAVAAVLTYGAAKYKIDSWQTVPNGAERYEDALDRHLNAWKSGEKNDEESGLHHLAHAACNVLFMLWFEMTANPRRDYTKFNDPTKLCQK